KALVEADQAVIDAYATAAALIPGAGAAISLTLELSNAGIDVAQGEFKSAALRGGLAALGPVAAGARRLGSARHAVDGAVGATSAAKGGTKPLGPGTRIGAKIEKQMAGRGWNRSAIDKLIGNPTKKRAVRDTRHLPGGGQLDDPATAYINRQGHYVIRNDRTGDIVQVSDRHNLDWSAPWD
ncbi:MAG: hypothetical protein GY733_10130, partial [bacterium]|nr:hypothetical protein [bacterium]